MRYAEYHFQHKLWNKNEMLEYLGTCCFSKNVAFNAIEAFQQIQGYHRPDVWQKYEAFGIDIYFASMPLDLCSENALDWCNANKLPSNDGSISTKG